MAVTIDKRDTTKVMSGGSDLCEVLLTADEQDEVFGGTATGPAYVILGYLKGGQVGEDYETETIKSEGGVIVKTKINTQEAIFENTMLQTDAIAHKLLDLLSDGTTRKYRYLLPNQSGYQVLGMYAGVVDKSSWRMGTSEGEIRERGFTVKGGKDTDGNGPLVIDDVDGIEPADQATWPATLTAFADPA